MSTTTNENDKINMLATSPYNVCFVLKNEDHTLGNSLRYIISKDKEVDFVGYSIPHPSDNVVNIRVQSKESCPASTVFTNGANNLKSIFNIINEKFTEANSIYVTTR